VALPAEEAVAMAGWKAVAIREAAETGAACLAAGSEAEA
jgi:hypothetical protein